MREKGAFFKFSQERGPLRVDRIPVEVRLAMAIKLRIE